MPDTATIARIQQEMRTLSETVRLPFRHQNWRGLSGNLLGAGIGSSIDFQDQRPYTPGDDPRYINWQAYARTGHYLMKLYREEVSPRVEILVDTTWSMFSDEAKARRTLELVYFCLESSLQTSATVLIHLLGQDLPRLLPLEQAAAAAFPLGSAPSDKRESASTAAPRLPELRHSSLRVFISDLLFEADVQALAAQLVQNRGRAIVFSPHTSAEADPDWDGNLELLDDETLHSRIQRISPSILDTYRAAYLRHFDIWKTALRKKGVPFCRLDCHTPFREVLLNQAAPAGAIELWT